MHSVCAGIEIQTMSPTGLNGNVKPFIILTLFCADKMLGKLSIGSS